MPKSDNRVERKIDSLLFVLANKSWTALASIALAAGLLVAGYFLGALLHGG